MNIFHTKRFNPNLRNKDDTFEKQQLPVAFPKEPKTQPQECMLVNLWDRDQVDALSHMSCIEGVVSIGTVLAVTLKVRPAISNDLGDRDGHCADGRGERIWLDCLGGCGYGTQGKRYLHASPRQRCLHHGGTQYAARDVRLVDSDTGGCPCKQRDVEIADIRHGLSLNGFPKRNAQRHTTAKRTSSASMARPLSLSPVNYTSRSGCHMCSTSKDLWSTNSS